jgi:putative sigma-54 modulation protein
MQITVSGNQLEVIDDLRRYASEIIRRVRKHFDHLTATKVVLQAEKNSHKVGATPHANGATRAAAAQAHNMVAAIDVLAESSIVRCSNIIKEKRLDHHRDEGSPKRLRAP